MAVSIQELQLGLNQLNARRRELEEELALVKERIATQSGALMYAQQVEQERQEEQKQKKERVAEATKDGTLAEADDEVPEIEEGKELAPGIVVEEIVPASKDVEESPVI